ncbi:MAG: flavin reductase family protein [Actinomycetes bacterium]
MTDDPPTPEHPVTERIPWRPDPGGVDGSVADPDTFRAVMGRFATGVSVMTTVVDGEPHGMTANALTSVSLDPLLVLVCVAEGAVMSQQVAASGVFALTFLAADQAEASARFADPSRPAGVAQFAGVPTSTAVTGSPLLDGGVAWLDCELWATYPGGDHDIVVGRVVAQGVSADASPPALLYYRSGYGVAQVD